MEPDRHYLDQIDDLFDIDQSRSSHYSMPAEHYHNSYELYYLLDGRRNYFIKNRIYSIEKGVLVFIGMHELHRTTSAGTKGYERILINFKPAFIDTANLAETAWLLSCFDHSVNTVRLSPQEQVQVESLLGRMMQENARKENGYELYLKTMLIELLIILNRAILHNPSDTSGSPELRHQKVMEIVQYINGHFAESISLSKLSKQFFISESYLCRIFKQVTGYHFTEYVNQIRIKESIRMLRETSLNITQIAEKAGYDSAAHYGRVFRSITGQSPRNYRKSRPDRI